LRKIVGRIVEKYKPKRIYLFGSYARGDFNEGSDVDLVVVGDFKERFIDRIGGILRLNDTDLEIEPMAYTEEEFERMDNRGNRFIEAVKKGNLIYSS
jgi:predicted nucleotidyltransferase